MDGPTTDAGGPSTGSGSKGTHPRTDGIGDSQQGHQDGGHGQAQEAKVQRRADSEEPASSDRDASTGTGATGETNMNRADGQGGANLFASGPLTDSPPTLAAIPAPTSTPLKSPAITQAVERDRVLPGRRSSSSFSSVHFVDAAPPPARKGSGSEISAATPNVSRAPNGRKGSAELHEDVGEKAVGGAAPRHLIASNLQQSSDASAAPVPSPVYTPSRLSVSRPILRSRSSEGTSQSDRPTFAPSHRDVDRRDSASGTSTPRLSVSRRVSGNPLNGTTNIRGDLSASHSSATQDGGRSVSGSVDKLQVKHQRSRTGSLIAYGARTSAVTGGYESSSASETDRDDLVHPQRSAAALSAARHNSIAGPSRPHRSGSKGTDSAPGRGSPTRSFPDFALDTATSLPHGGGSTAFALNRKRAKSLTISSVQGFGSPRRILRTNGQEDGGQRHTYGMHTPSLPMERSGSDKSIHRRRNAPVVSRSASRDPLRRVSSSSQQPQSALPSLGSASGSTSIHTVSSGQVGAEAGRGTSSSGVFSRGPSRMPSHHSTLSARSSTHFTSMPPRTPPGPSRMSSRIPILPTALDDDIAETPSPVSAASSRAAAPIQLPEQVTLSVNADQEQPRTSDKRHRDKGKQRAGANRRDGLASSLGLMQGGKDAVLTAEQIQHLLSSSDVASAIQAVGSGAPLSQITSVSRTGPMTGSAGGGWQGGTGKEVEANGQSQADQRREPFLASAPPALTSGTPNDKFSRERTISVSTMGTPGRRDWDRDTDDGRDGRDDLASAGPSRLGHRTHEGDDELRKRTLSNATSSGSGPRVLNGRRRSTRLSHGESEGHVAFTHFPRPDRATFIDSDDDDAEERSSAVHTVESSLNGSSASHARHTAKDPTATPAKAPKAPEKTKLTKSASGRNSLRHSLLGPNKSDREDKGKDKEKRHRSISAIFHLPGTKRKSESTNALAHMGNGNTNGHLATSDAEHGAETEIQRDAAERARRAKEEKEAHMRKKEAERREDEESQERYYRALMQVNAHPHAVRLSDRAKVHLWAYYQHVYDGLDDPPRLNPLAVIRWRMRTEEQDDRRRDWQAEHGHILSQGPDKLLDGHRSPGSNSLSPMTQPRPLHLSPSPYKPQSLAMSDQSRQHSQSHRSLASDSSRGNGSYSARQLKKSTAQTRWTYNIQDIEGYKAAEGVVRYFIPPLLPATPMKELKEREEVNDLTALEHPDEQDGESTRRLEDEGSSLGGSVGRSGGVGLRFSNEGASRERVDEMGVITEGRPMTSRHASYLNGSRTSIDMLSRSVSRETDKHGSLRRGHGGGSLRKSHSTSHRHTHSITSKLLAPFEKVGELVKEGARRQSTSPYPHGNAHMAGYGSDTQDNLSQLHLPRGHRFSPSVRNSISISTDPNVSMRGGNANAGGLGSRKQSKAQIASPEPQSTIASAHPGSLVATPISANMLRSKTDRFFRGRGAGNGNLTDAAGTDDEQALPRRGFRNSMANLRKATRGDRVELAATPTPPMGPAAGPVGQGAVVPDHLRVPVYKTPRALEKSRAVSDVYAERARQLAVAQKQLLAVEQSLELSSQAGSQYLTEMDMLKQMFDEVADVQVVWPDLDELIAVFAPRPVGNDRHLAPLTVAAQANRISAANRVSTNPKRGLPHHMRYGNSIGSGSASGSESDHLRMSINRRGSHRQSLSGNNSLSRITSNGPHHPGPSRRIDKLSQAREAVTRAEGQYSSMREQQAKAENRLRGLLGEIDEIQSTGKKDLAWLEAKIEEIKAQKDTIAGLQPRKPRPWHEYVPDHSVHSVFETVTWVFWLVVNVQSVALEIIFHPVQKLLGIRESTTWWTVIVRVSLLVAAVGVILAYTLGGGEGPLETPKLVRQPASWSGEVFRWGWRNMRVGWEGTRSRLEKV